jgi:hypothetical protein
LEASGGTLRVTQQTCNLAQFKIYISSFASRIQFAMGEVDNRTAVSTGKVDVDMRNLLNTSILIPITEIIDGGQCSFIGQHYQDFVKGLCHQTVVGLNRFGDIFMAVGGLMCGIVFAMYALWRRAGDNVAAQQKEAPLWKTPEDRDMTI